MDNATKYTILAYAISMVLLWGYALVLWMGWRSAPRARAEAQEEN